MIVLGLLAAAGLGLMALRGLTLLLAPESENPFYFPLQISIPLALGFGLVVTYWLGRYMGLYGLRTLRDYETRRRVREEVLGPTDERPPVPEATIEY